MSESVGLKEEKLVTIAERNPKEQSNTESLGELLTPPTEAEERVFMRALSRIEDVLVNVLCSDDISEDIAKRFVEAELYSSRSPLSDRVSIITSVIHDALKNIDPEKITMSGEAFIETLTEKLASFENFVARVEKGHSNGVDGEGASYQLLTAAINSLSLHLSSYEGHLAALFYKEPPLPDPESFLEESKEAKEPSLDESLTIPECEVIQPEIKPQEKQASPLAPSEEKTGSLWRRFLSSLSSWMKSGMSEGSDDGVKDVYYRTRHNDGRLNMLREDSGALSSSEQRDSENEQSRKRQREHFLANTPSDGVIGLNQAENPLPDHSKEGGGAPGSASPPGSAASSQEMFKKGLDGKIVTEDQEFYNHVAVTAPAVTIDGSGKMLRLDTWLRAIKEANPDNAALPTYEECYKKKTVLPLSQLDEPTKEETECSRSAFSGDVTLPLSPLYTITGVSFLDRSGNEIKTEQNSVDECVFGSARVIAPPGTIEVSYRVRAKRDQRIDPDLVRKFEYSLPQVSGYSKAAETLEVERLSALECEPADKTQLWLDSVKDTPYGYLYTMSDPIQHLINASVPHVETFIAALKASDCQGFSFHASARLRSLGLGALVIGGPVPDKVYESFQVGIGHAQTLVMGKKGLTILDLTKYVKSSLEAEALPIDWKQIVADLQGLSAKETHAIAEEVGKLIRQMSGISTHDLDVKNHRYALKGWDRFKHSLLYGRSKALIPSQAAGHRLADSIENAKTNPFAKVMAVQKYLSEIEDVTKAALSQGSLRSLYRFLEDNPPPILRLGYYEEKLVGEEYADLVRCCGSMVKEMLIQATESVLQQEEYSSEAKRECVAWIAQKSVPSNVESFEKRVDYKDIDTVKPSGSYLSLTERCRLVTEDVRKTFSDKELLEFNVVFHNDVRELCSRSVQKYSDYDFGVEALKNSLKTLELCSRELSQRSLCIAPDKRHQIFLRSLTQISDTVFFRAKNEFTNDETRVRFNEMKDSLVHTFDCILQRGERPAPEVALNLLASVSRLERREMVAMLQEVWSNPDSFLVGSSYGESSFSAVTARYLMPRVQAGNNDHYLLKNLEEVGIEIDLSQHREKLEEAFSDAGSKLSIRWQDQAINYPDEESPASYLIERLCSLEAARYHRYIDSIVSSGGLRKEVVKANWPQVPETDVAYRLAALLEIHDEKLQIQDSEYTNRQAAVEIRPEDIRCLVEAGFKHGPLSKAFLKHYYDSNPEVHELEAVFSAIKDSYPEAWEELRKSLYGVSYHHEARSMGALFARYAEGIDKVSFYRAALSLAESRLRESADDKKLQLHTPNEIEKIKEKNVKQGIIQLINELGRKRAGEILVDRKIFWETAFKERQLEKQFDVLINEYRRILKEQAAKEADANLESYCLNIGESDFSRELLEEVYASARDTYDAHKDAIGERELALAALLAGVSNEHNHNVVSQMCEKTGMPITFMSVLLRGIEKSDTDGMQRVWEYLRSDLTSSSLTGSLPRVINDVKAKVERASLRPHALRPATFSSYLYDKTGRKTPLQYEGDFEEFRSYSQGMDWKRVDQKVLARTDKPYIRHYRDRQKYKVVALVELEWLAEEASLWRREQLQIENKQSTEKSHQASGNRRTIAEFPKLEELYTNLLLAEKDGYQPKLRFTFRGHPVELVQKGERDTVETYAAPDFLNRLERALCGASWVCQSEKAIYEEGQYQGRGPILPQYLEDLKNTVVLCGIDSGNIQEASWFFNVIKKRGGDSIPLEIRES